MRCYICDYSQSSGSEYYSGLQLQHQTENRVTRDPQGREICEECAGACLGASYHQEPIQSDPIDEEPFPLLEELEDPHDALIREVFGSPSIAPALP